MSGEVVLINKWLQDIVDQAVREANEQVAQEREEEKRAWVLREFAEHCGL